MLFRERLFQLVTVDVSSTTDPTHHRTGGGLQQQTARVNRTPYEPSLEAIAEDHAVELHKGLETCWRVQLSAIEFSSPEIYDTANGGKASTSPIVATVQWGVDGVTHTAEVDWNANGNSFVVSGDVVNVGVNVPATYAGPAPAVETYSITMAEMWFLPYGATTGPEFTIAANADMLFTYQFGAETVVLSVPAGFYSAATLVANVNAQLAAFVLPTISLSFDLATGLFVFTYAGAAPGDRMDVQVFNAGQAAFASQLGYPTTGAFPQTVFTLIDPAAPLSSTATPLADSLVQIAAGTYDSVALEANISAQLAPLVGALWSFQFVYAGSPTFGLKANMDAIGGGAWYVRDATQAPGWLGRFGYTAPGRITAQADGLALQSDADITYDPVYGSTPAATLVMGATIVEDCGESPLRPTRSFFTGALAAAGVGTAMIEIPRYARSFRWHLVTTATAGSGATGLRFTQTQTQSITAAVVANTPLTDPKAGGAPEFTTSESTWPSDDGITLVAQARYLWITNEAEAGEVSLRIEFELDIV